jgi:aminoglycoside 6'-N-acetyltransferase
MIAMRPATADDIALLRRWDEEPDVVASDPHDDWDWERELAAPMPGFEHFIAEVDARPIGFVQLLDPAVDPSRYWGDVPPGLRAIDIWIGDAADRGRGHGTAMMRWAIARCFAPPDVTAIVIDPLESNTGAIRFYDRLGFRFVERRRFGQDDCHVMRLDRTAWR